jgi:hypothetical protein
MKTNSLSSWLRLVAVLGLAGEAPLATQADLLINGGFETGFAGWTLGDAIGSDGSFHLQTGALSPVNGFPLPTPPEGLAAAMTDAFGPGSHVLYQDFLVPTPVSAAVLEFSLLINNGGDDFYAPSTLEFSGLDLNQQARVDVLLTSADPFSIAASDVLLNVYQTQPGDLLFFDYTTIQTDLTSLFLAHPGETLRLRFAEVDNVLFFNLGIDDVSLRVTNLVPEASTWLVMPVAVGLATVSLRQRRRRLAGGNR